MPMRNPFRRQAPPDGLGPLINGYGNRKPGGSSLDESDGGSTMGSTTPSTVSLASRRDEAGEYKLSVVNDSGVYLPPSPTQERPQSWLKTSRLNSSSGRSHRSRPSTTDEPFSNISRESFDSYRRSFDVAARSPVLSSPSSSTHYNSNQQPTSPARTSLDSRLAARSSYGHSMAGALLANGSDQVFRNSSFASEHPREEEEEEGQETEVGKSRRRSAVFGAGRHADGVEEGGADQFEDVGLNDDPAPTVSAKPARRGIFARFGGGGSLSAAPVSHRPGSSGRDISGGLNGSGGTPVPSGLGIFHGRKRGQSGQGAELAAIPTAAAATTAGPAEDRKRPTASAAGPGPTTAPVPVAAAAPVHSPAPAGSQNGAGPATSAAS